MRLQDIHLNYRTDKGTTHSYINIYDELFFSVQDRPMHILEIGVLFGESLKLWNDYFKNSKIYGIDNFSQKDGHSYHNYRPVIFDNVKKDLCTYDRIELFNIDSENINEVNNNLKDLFFNIIIDDASHSLKNQMNNIKNFIPRLKLNGFYIIEDVQSESNCKELVDLFYNITNKNPKVYTFNKTSDDRMIIYGI
jgi:hypothetical protein